MSAHEREREVFAHIRSWAWAITAHAHRERERRYRSRSCERELYTPRFIPPSAHNDWSQCHFNNEWRYCFIIGMFIDGCDWFRKLQSVWLTIIIWHNSSSFHRLYGKTLMFILLSYQTGFNPQYMFMQTIGFFCHGENMDNEIKVFKLVLNEFYTYLVGWNNKISKNYSLFSRLIQILMLINYFVIYSNASMLVYVRNEYRLLIYKEVEGSKKIRSYLLTTWTLLDILVVFRLSQCICGKNFRALSRPGDEIAQNYILWKLLKLNKKLFFMRLIELSYLSQTSSFSSKNLVLYLRKYTLQNGCSIIKK